MKAPYLTDTVSLDKDLTGLDFVVALAHDGKTPSVNFNQWVDKAYKKTPLFAVVKPDPGLYKGITLGVWPLPENDPAYKWFKSHFLAPDGKTHYAISAVLIDMRSYVDPNGNPYTGGWVAETAKHWRSWFTGWGFKTFLFVAPQLEQRYPDNSKDPAVYVQGEKAPVAVYETGTDVCKWPATKMLKRVSISEWESIYPIGSLYNFIDWKPVVVEPPVIPYRHWN